MNTIFIELLSILIISLPLGLIPAFIAKHKGRNFFLWWLYGWGFFILALPHSLLMSHKNKCPRTDILVAIALVVFIIGIGYHRNVRLIREYPAKNKNLDSKYESDLIKSKKVSDTLSVDVKIHKEITIMTSDIDQELQTSKESDTVEIDTIWIETKKYVCGISQLGARIVSLGIKGYDCGKMKSNYSGNETRYKYIELIPSNRHGACNLSVNNINLDSILFKSSITTKRKALFCDSVITISFLGIYQDNKSITKDYIFNGNSYKIGCRIRSAELEGKLLSIGWKCGVRETYAIGKNQTYEPRSVFLFDGRNVIERIISRRPDELIERSGPYQWFAITSNYFFVSIVQDKVEDSEWLINSFNDLLYNCSNNNIKQRFNRTLNYSVEMKTFTYDTVQTYWILFGPMEVSKLKNFGINLDKIVFHSSPFLLRSDIWIPFLNNTFLWLIVHLQRILKYYGVVLILISIIIYLLTYPIMRRGLKSFKQINKLTQKINEIKDQQDLDNLNKNKQIIDIYRNEDVKLFNPGYLAMLIQMPIFLIIYYLFEHAIELNCARLFIIPWATRLNQPENLSTMAFLRIMLGVSVYILLRGYQKIVPIREWSQYVMISFATIFFPAILWGFPPGPLLFFLSYNILAIINMQIIVKRITFGKIIQKLTNSKWKTRD